MVKVTEDLPEKDDGSLDVDRWFERLPKKLSKADQAYLKSAIEYAAQFGLSTNLHQGMMVAEILSALDVDIHTLLAAVLYWSLSLTAETRGFILSHFSEETIRLLEGLDRLERARSAIPHASHSSSFLKKDNVRRLLLAVVQDIRVVLLKLSQQVVLLRLGRAIPQEVLHHLAQETKEVFAPLANRLGIGQLKWELEDLAFRYLEPEKYQFIARLLAEKRAQRVTYVHDFVIFLQKKLEESSIAAKVSGRPKHIYSIYKKMQKKALPFEDIYDVRAVRIITDSVADCYQALAIVHALWEPMTQEFDDYIATPKENGYRSLHTVVIGPQNKGVEIQIRTQKMHQQAEMGVAAHWAYKEQVISLQKVLNWKEDESNTDSTESATLADLAADIFKGKVYVFTPKGDILELHEGDTVLDFAYHIHTSVGHRCRGVKVNSAIVPLNTLLKSGDKVEVLTGKIENPSLDWMSPHLGYLNSHRAKSKVQAWFREQSVANESGLAAQDLPKTVASPLQKKIPTLNDVFKNRCSLISIAGIENVAAFFAKCCKPIPGDNIMGYITQGRGVSVHRSNCPHIQKMTLQSRLISVNWKEGVLGYFLSDVQVISESAPHLLNEVAAILSREKLALQHLRQFQRSHGLSEMIFSVQVRNQLQVDLLISRLSQVSGVISVRRMGTT